MTRSALSGLLTLAVLLAAVTVPLAATATAADAPEFEENIEHIHQGETAEIAVTVPAGDEETTVEIGSEQVNFLVRATVADADGDGRVVLRLDTETAGKGGTDTYLSVSDGDELRSAEQVTPELRSPIHEGDYDLSLVHDGEEVDAGTLVVAARETTSGGTTSDAAAGTSLVYEGDRLTLAAADGQIVRGETTLDPGTSVVVQIRSRGDNPFLMSNETAVAEDGTFEAIFDLSDVPEGAEFDVTVRGDGSELASAGGRVACEGSCPTTASTPPTTTFAVTNTESPDGGFLGDLGGVGALALGAVLAVVGVGLLLGVFRT